MESKLEESAEISRFKAVLSRELDQGKPGRQAVSSIPILGDKCNPVHQRTGAIVSVSLHWDNAVSMGQGIEGLKDKDVYLFECSVPKIDLIDPRRNTPFSWRQVEIALRQSLQRFEMPGPYFERCVYGPDKVLGLRHPDGREVYRTLESSIELFAFGELNISKSAKVSIEQLCHNLTGPNGCWSSRAGISPHLIDSEPYSSSHLRWGSAGSTTS